jgi:hypothetical protein
MWQQCPAAHSIPSYVIIMSVHVKNGDYHRQNKLSLLWKEGTSAYDITISLWQSVMKQHLATILSADG